MATRELESDLQGASPRGAPRPDDPVSKQAFDLEFRRRIKARDPAAWEVLATEYHAVLCRQAARILPPHMDSENAVGEMWVRALRSCRRYDVQRQPYPWLARICARTCLDQRRGILRSVARLTRLHALSNDGSSSLPSQESGPGLAWALKRLPAREREVVVLRYLFNVPVAEIQVLLGMKSEALRKTRRRGLARLRRMLVEAGQVPTEGEAVAG